MPDDVTPSETVTPTPATPTPSTPPSLTLDQIPQSLVDQIEARNKRGLQAKIAELQQQNQALTGLRDQSATFLELLGDRVQLEEGTDLGDVATQITGTLDGLKTESERLNAVNKKKDEMLSEAQKRAEAMQKELHDTLTLNQINANLIGENGSQRAVSPKAAELIAKELAALAKVGDDRSVTFEMEVLDEESGTKVKKAVDAKTAVATLESNAEWKHFFTATVNSGAGGDVVDNVQRSANGALDINALIADPKKYMEIMDKDPGLIDEMMAKMG